MGFSEKKKKQNLNKSTTIIQYKISRHKLFLTLQFMKSGIKDFWQILKQTAKDFIDYNIPRMGAALAYYTVFSIAPMMIIVIRFCDIFLSRDAIEGTLYHQIKNFVGETAAMQIQELIKNASLSKDVTWASVIGIITLVLAATGVFGEIQDSINFIWRLKPKARKGWLKILTNRLLSFSMIISLGFILLVSLVANALMDILSNQLVALFPQLAVYLAYSLNMLLTFIVTSFLFGTIFKVLPDAKIEWKDVRAGAFTTAALFLIGKFLIGFYLGSKNISSAYGAAGSIILILLWVYYSALILYFGAAFTKVNAHYRGRKIYPNDYAVWIQQVEMESNASLEAQPDNVKIKD